MSILMCPVCKNPLLQDGKRYICKNNHSFDISKKGYVNLLMSNASKEKRHGDDKAMISARTDFLERGFYSPLSKAVSEMASEEFENKISPTVFECGCGECYYLSNLGKALAEKNISPVLYGMDISKEALPFGKKRDPQIKLFAASAFKLPLLNESVDIAISIFAPMDIDEMSRVLKKGGLLIKVIPKEEHLIELKRVLYDNVYLNRPVVESCESLEILSNETLEYKFTLKNGEEIESLFKMTPYYYKTSATAQQKLLSMEKLEITASFGLIKYKKK